MSARTQLVMASVAIAFAVVACGSSNANDLFSGSGADGGIATDDGGADGASDAPVSAADGATSADAGDASKPDARPADTGPPPLTCAQRLQQIDALRPKAIACLDSVGVQCDEQVEDVCCPVTLNKVSLGTAAVKDFRAAVEAFKKASCNANCPDVACHDSPSYYCEVSGLGARCAQ